MYPTTLIRTKQPAEMSNAREKLAELKRRKRDIIQDLIRFPQSPTTQPTRSELNPEMPLLSDLQRKYGSLAGSIGGLVGLQHLFGSTATLIKTLTDGKVSPKGVFLLGKPYSANRHVVRDLQFRHGFWVHPRSTFQPVDRPNDDEMDNRIRTTLAAARRWLNRETGNGQDRVLLIDDGGRAINMLHTPEFANICGRFTAVEQTRAGARVVKKLNLKMPVINVAESRVKLEHESPMIARSVISELNLQLHGLVKSGIPVGPRVLVIGYGAIGRAVAVEMRRQARRVEVFDRDKDRLEQAVRDGYRIFNHLRTALAGGGVVVGCTGTPVLSRDDHPFLADGTILVSASSADVEFRGWQIRPYAKPLGRPQFWSTADRSVDGGLLTAGINRTEEDSCPCFCLYQADFGGRRVYLVNGGFPVNFNGQVDPIVPEEIQLTRGLLYIGAIQSSIEQRPGLHELNDKWQHYLFNAYRQLTCRPEFGGARC